MARQLPPSVRRREDVVSIGVSTFSRSLRTRTHARASRTEISIDVPGSDRSDSRGVSTTEPPTACCLAVAGLQLAARIQPSVGTEGEKSKPYKQAHTTGNAQPTPTVSPTPLRSRDERRNLTGSDNENETTSSPIESSDAHPAATQSSKAAERC